LTGQHEQLSVDDKQLGDGVLEAAASFDSRADSVDPVSGNGFDVLLAVDHESECVERMSGALSAMTAQFPAPPMGEHEGPRKSVGRDAEARQKPTLAAFQGGGLGSHRRIWRDHLKVIILSAFWVKQDQSSMF
jgi:hypothetical protein